MRASNLGALGDAAPGGKPANAVLCGASLRTGDDVISIQNRLKDWAISAARWMESSATHVSRRCRFQRVSHLTKDGMWARSPGTGCSATGDQQVRSSSSAVLRLNYRDSGEDVAVQQRPKEPKYFTKTVTLCMLLHLPDLRSFKTHV